MVTKENTEKLIRELEESIRQHPEMREFYQRKIDEIKMKRWDILGIPKPS